MPTNDANHKPGEYEAGKGEISYPNPGPDSAKLGYETTDVNVSGVIVFLGGLFGFVLIFFVFCFFMGRLIDDGLNKEDGPTSKWNKELRAKATGSDHRREDLKSNAAIEQQQLQQMTAQFPSPRLQMDDGNQDTADLHAREDLLLDHYSTVPGQPGIRIPIDQAMLLIAQKGLPVAPSTPLGSQLAYDKQPSITVPLTSGFARTGYELDTIEAREQKLDYGRAKDASHAQLHPVK